MEMNNAGAQEISRAPAVCSQIRSVRRPAYDAKRLDIADHGNILHRTGVHVSKP